MRVVTVNTGSELRRCPVGEIGGMPVVHLTSHLYRRAIVTVTGRDRDAYLMTEQWSNVPSWSGRPHRPTADLSRAEYARLRNAWNLTDPTTDGRTFEQFVADERNA